MFLSSPNAASTESALLPERLGAGSFLVPQQEAILPRGATDLPPEPDRTDLTDWLEWRRLYSGDHIGAMIEIGKQLEELRRFVVQIRAELHELKDRLTDDGR